MSDGLTRHSFTVFRQALEVAADRRTAFVRDACGDDTGLRRRVDALVAAVDRTEGFLETPITRGEQAGVSTPGHLAPGTVVGGYEITSVIGVGGMGTVYEAMQERPRRQVALKVMQRAVATAEARRRFEFEAEVLARLRHPGIAQIHESGTYDDGATSLPWFAMEYIPSAQPITEYVRACSLDLRAKLTLFAAVCDAVQHGHQKGVIHRDLKPGNILIDAKGQPKVIDFGIARLTDPGQVAITQTNIGQLIGTLNYMSPEQCEAGASDLDVRADVYALGVVLYEIVCGRLPHDLAHVPVVEALRIIRTEAPVRPAVVDGGLRGDVEAIVLKAMDKDRERRYRSAGGIGSDLRRYLGNEMIEARPMTVLYQLQLFARRNRGLIAAALAVAIAIVAGVAASVSFAVRARAEASRRHTAELTAIAERDAARWQAYVANVGAAFYAFEAGEFQWMRARLREAPVALRGWEWSFLDARAELSLRHYVAHTDMVFDMDASSDRRRLATASRDGTIRIWDAETDSLIATGVGHETWVMAIAFSPDDRQVVSASWDKTLRVWDASTGEALLVYDGHHEHLAGVDWGPGGVIASASIDGVVRLWDSATGAAIETFRTEDGGKSGVSFSSDGRRLATWGAGPTLTVRNAATREMVREFTAAGTITAVAWSPDDRRIVAATDPVTRVWDYDRGEILYELATEGDPPRGVVFSADATRLAVGMGRAIVLWDLAAGGRETRVLGHEETVAKICFGPDDRRLYSASWDRTIRFWDPDAQATVTTLRGHDGDVLSTAFSPDGAIVASASDDGTIRLWDPALGVGIRTIPAHGDKVRAVAFSPDGATLASASYDRTVRLWDVASGTRLDTLDGHTAHVDAVAFSPNGACLASGSSDRTIRLWDVASRTTTRTLEGHTARVNDLAFSPDGSLLASASRDGTVRIWEVLTGDELHTLTGHASDVFAVLFSHDGRRLYSGSRDQTVRVWDPGSGAGIDMLDGHGQFVTSLTMSPDGTRLAAGSWFGKIVLWDVATGDELATLTGHDDTIRSVAWDPSGRRIVSGSTDGTVRIWDSTRR